MTLLKASNREQPRLLPAMALQVMNCMFPNSPSRAKHPLIAMEQGTPQTDLVAPLRSPRSLPLIVGLGLRRMRKTPRRTAAGLEEPGTDWREPSQLDRLVEMNPEAAEAARKLVGQEALLEAERQRIKAEGEALLQQARAKLADVERREIEASPAAEVPPEWKQQRAYQYDAWIQQQFPEYGNDAAMRETARIDPERWAQLLYTRSQAERQLQADTFIASEQFKAQAQAQRQQFSELARWDDTQFAKNHPEFENPKVAERVREGIFQMYEQKYNVSREQLKVLWKSNPQVRSYAGQEAMLADWRQWEAQKQMKQGRARPTLPPVQRPAPPARGTTPQPPH
jgi:hypothetical protein